MATDPNAKWYAYVDKVTGEPAGYCTDDCQGFDLEALKKTFDVHPIIHQPRRRQIAGQSPVIEYYDKVTKTIKE